MAGNSETTVTVKKPRGPGRKFKKGQSGNPNGRPKLTSEELDLIAACKNKTPDALAVIEEIMLNGQSEKARFSAALAIIERAHGKPVQPTQLSGQNGGPIEIAAIERRIVDSSK